MVGMIEGSNMTDLRCGLGNRTLALLNVCRVIYIMLFLGCFRLSDYTLVFPLRQVRYDIMLYMIC